MPLPNILSFFSYLLLLRSQVILDVWGDIDIVMLIIGIR